MEIRQPSPQDRFQVLETPRMAPGQCGICGSAKKPMVDFGMSFRGYGRFYICVEDMASAARAIGFVPAVEAGEAVDSVVETYLAETGQRLVRAEDADRVDAFYADLRDFASRHLPSPIQDAPVVAEDHGTAVDGDDSDTKRVDRRSVRGTDETDVDSVIQDTLGISVDSSDESGVPSLA